MSSNQPPSQPYPPQQAPGYPPPPPPQKKKHTLRNILLIIIALSVLFIGGCAAIFGMAANEVSKSIDKSIASDSEPGGPDNPLTIKPGQAFEVSGFKYAEGWKVKREFGGYVNITGLKVTNERDKKDSALVEIKFWKGSEVLALSDCTTEPIAPDTTVTISCSSGDKLPKAYEKVTINDTF